MDMSLLLESAAERVQAYLPENVKTVSYCSSSLKHNIVLLCQDRACFYTDVPGFE